MFISNGWSGEYASGTWGKVNVGCGEEDLARILIDYAKEKGSELLLPAELSTTDVFKLLTWEVERLLNASLASRVADKEACVKAVSEASINQQALLAQLTQTKLDNWKEGV